jgi:hypothetical protein
MAQQDLNGPDSPHMVPHAQEPSAERGDRWKDLIDKIQANFTDLYGQVAAAQAQAEMQVVSAVIEGGAAGDHTVTGIWPGDELIAVVRLIRNATAANINIADLQAEFTISAGNTINNTGGTDTTGDSLLVLYRDLTTA